MIRYGEEPSNQMAIPGLGLDGQELMEEARKWVMLHRFKEWEWYMAMARDESRDGGKASPNFCPQAMRRHFKCKIPNAYAPCLARIAMEQDKRISFRLAKSKVDGYTDARL